MPQKGPLIHLPYIANPNHLLPTLKLSILSETIENNLDLVGAYVHILDGLLWCVERHEGSLLEGIVIVVHSSDVVQGGLLRYLEEVTLMLKCHFTQVDDIPLWWIKAEVFILLYDFHRHLQIAAFLNFTHDLDSFIAKLRCQLGKHEVFLCFFNI